MKIESKELWEVIPSDRLIVEALKEFQTMPQIEALEKEMLECANAPIKTKHFYGAGIYAREIFMPKGTIAIGHAHTEECLNIVVSGSVSVLIEGESKRISAPATFSSAPFSRKVGYVHEDLTWITVHQIGSRSIDEIEDKIFAKSEAFKAFEAKTGTNAIALASMNSDDCWDDRLDYLEVLRDRNLTQEQVAEIVLNADDITTIPDKWIGRTYIGTSRIHKNGILCGPFHAFPDTNLGPARIGLKRTELGRYTNHSRHPNAEFKLASNGDVYLIAKKLIIPDQEITVNYREALLIAREADKFAEEILTLKQS